jgi:hypothetical protein
MNPKSFGPSPLYHDDQGLDPELLSFHSHRIHYDLRPSPGITWIPDRPSSLGQRTDISARLFREEGRRLYQDFALHS